MNDDFCSKRSRMALALMLFAVFASGTLLAQAGPDVVHAGIECIPQTEFAVMMASIRPGGEVQTARVYFRSNMYPDFYYVDMAGTGEQFQAILPKPSPETAQVIYYIEAVNVGFSSNRTAEHSADVVEDENECRRRDPAAAYFTGENPSIVVGALKAGMPPVPAGFLTEGITGFIPLSGSGGGAGAATALAIGGAAAGAVGVGVLAAGGDQATTTTSAVVAPPPPPPTTTSVPSVPPPSPSVKACFDTSPASAVIEIGERIKLDARCSEPTGSLTFTWDLGDGRKREGPFIEPSYSSPGTYTVVLTVRRATSFRGLGQSVADEDRVSRQIIVKEPKGADLSVTKTGSPDPYDPFDETPLTYTITVENLGPATATEVTLVDTLPPDMMVLDNGGCLPSGQGQLICRLGDISSGDIAQVTIELVVDFQQEPELGPFVENRVEVDSETEDPDTSNNAAVARTNLLWEWEQRVSSIELAFTSLLRFRTTDDPSVGHVVLNGGRVDTTTSGTSFPHRFQGQPGRNTIEAYPVSGAGREGTWRFDFSTAPSFVAGSFRAEVGQVISQDIQGIVFHLSGQAGERLRFSFELLPRGR